jgi:hypothetical protein
MSLRIALNLSELTWAELIGFVDSVRSDVRGDDRVEVQTDAAGVPVSVAATVPGNSVGRGPAVIGADEAARYADALRQALLGDVTPSTVKLRELLEVLA